MKKTELIILLFGIVLCVLIVYGLWIEYYIFDNISVIFGVISGIYITIGMLYQLKSEKAKKIVTASFYGEFGIIDDNCYLDGLQVNFDSEKPFIIVVGERAIGKSLCSKEMSKYNKGIQYYSVQQLEYLDKRIRENAEYRIYIKKEG